MIKPSVGLVLSIAFASPALAGPRERAKWLHDRLAGVPPSAQVLDQMEALIKQGKLEEAARIPTESEGFLKLTVKHMVTPWTNESEELTRPLNDYSATVIGYVRDEKDFSKITYEDIIYTGRDGLANVAPYDRSNNTHYQQFEDNGYSLQNDLVPRAQSSLTQLGVASGILTTRAFGEAYYSAGTNRAPIRFTLKTFLCRDMQQVTDNTRSDMYVGRDVDRKPGGDPLGFRSECAGCHAGMDGLRPAFAHIDHITMGTGTANVYTPGTPVEKLAVNRDAFPSGYIVTDDKWRNLWIEGQNKDAIGWRGASEGNGLAEFGAMLTNTQAFDSCMPAKVFETICLRSPTSAEDQSSIQVLSKKFADSKYNMKSLLISTALKCSEDK